MVGLERSHRYEGPFNRLQRAKEAAELRESIRQLSPVGFSLHHGSQGTRTRSSHSCPRASVFLRESISGWISMDSGNSKSRSGRKDLLDSSKKNRDY